MTTRVLDIGNCSPDHASIRSLLDTSFGAQVVQAHGLEDALEQLANQSFALILVNRKLDRDYSDGLDVIKEIKACEKFAEMPIMMITNFAEHQAKAVEAGALEGFGKLELASQATQEKLAAVLA
ncbi:MAG: response regulator [Pirellulaceae bacterium]|nr:response regulator [Pirellulaceae bacterium]